MIKDIKTQDKILLRIKKVKGQVAGIERMMENKRDCLEVIQQIAAVKSALTKLSSLLLLDNACASKDKNSLQFERTIKELVKNL